MKTKTVPIATFNTQAPAFRLRERLRQAGFESAIHDESRLERFWFLSEPLAAYHVEVPPADYLRACSFIAETDASEGLLQEAVRCPSCHSSRIEFPQITRKFLMPVIEAVLMTVGILQRRFYCQDCHYTWSLRGQPPPPELDVLGWPANSKLWHPEKFPKAQAAQATPQKG